MTSWESIASLAILAVVLLAILLRPYDITEAVPAVLGALVALLLQIESVTDAGDVVRRAADVLLFLAGMMILSALVDHAGVFARIAGACATWSGGSVLKLFVLVFSLGAICTAFLSLDVTVIVLTPIVFALTKQFDLPALPFLFVCTFVANIPSLIFPMSNLTNLLLYSEFDLHFGVFVLEMALPNLVAALATLVMLWLAFRASLPSRFQQIEAKREHTGHHVWFRCAAATLAVTLVGIIALGLLSLPLSWAAIVGAGVLLALSFATGQFQPRILASEVAWPVLPFVIGMLIIVDSVNRNALSHLHWAYPGGSLAGPIAAAAVAAVGSNIVNNVPMALLAVPFIRHSDSTTTDRLAYATLVGTNIGPTLTTYGSLATLLWISIVRKRGITISSRSYLRVAWIISPPVMLATFATLMVSLRWSR